MSDDNINTEEKINEQVTGAETSGPVLERVLCINSDDRKNWLLILAFCVIILATFHFPFHWMLHQWFRVEEYSPGPLVPILIVIIIWSQIKKMESRPIYPKKFLITLLVIGLVLAGLVYAGKELPQIRHPKSTEGLVNGIKFWLYQMMPRIGHVLEAIGNIAFDILFYVLTVFMVYAGYLLLREQKLNSTAAEGKTSDKVALGAVAIILGLVFHFLGMRGDLNRISLFAYIGVMYGFVWFVFGSTIGKKLMFAYAFLLFLVPMEFLDDYLGGPLRMLATRSSVTIMKGIGGIIGMEVIQEGTKFTINGDNFDVAPACSGLRSLVALSAIGAAYAYVTQPGILRKWLLGLSAIPIALATNVVRLVMVGVTCHFFKQKAAMRVHDSSIFLYIIAIFFLLSLDKIFDRLAKLDLIKKINFRWLKLKDF